MPAKIGGFKLVAKLGTGSMGQVFKAVQVSMDRPVALKVIPPQLARNAFFTDRFLAEARVAGKLSHPNVVSCYDVGNADGYMYMALEFVGGGDAAALAKRSGGKLDEQRALEIVRDCAAGLQAIHAAGLIHRDIKPANILLDERGKAKLGDLGLARGAGDEDGAIKHGGTVGTPAYISPEQAGGAELDIRTDIYSLSATLYKLVTGEAPFRGESVWEVVAKVINETVGDPRKINPEITARTAAIIRKGTAKEPSERYADPTALRADLELVLAGKDPLGAMPPAARARPAAQGQQRGATAKKAGDGEASAAPRPALRERVVERKETRVRSPWARRLRAALIGVVGLLVLAGIGWVFMLALANKHQVEERASKRQEIIDAANSLTPAPAPAAHPAPAKSAPPVESGPDPAVEAAAKQRMALPPDEQIKQIVAELRKLNSDYDGEIDYLAEGGQVVELTLSTLTLSRITPLATLKKLRTLHCRGERLDRKGNLDNLTPLKYLPITTLDVSNNTVFDLGPIAKLPLKRLDCRNNLIKNLAALHGMALERLDLAGNLVADLEPLHGMPLSTLNLSGCNLSDLSPLAGSPLKSLDISRTAVTDLTPLKGLALEELALVDGKITDLAPLHGMHLASLSIQGSLIGDLSPLAGMPLRALSFTPEYASAGIPAVRALGSLEYLDSAWSAAKHPPSEFWTRYDQGEFTAKARGEEPLAAPGAKGNVLVNGDFETRIGARPVGWILDEQGSIANEAGNHFLRITANANADGSTRRQLILDPTWKTLAIGVRMRAKDLHPGKERGSTGRMYVYFTDGRGNRVGTLQHVGALGGDSDWTRFDTEATIPAGAKRLDLDCQVYQATGVVDFDDVTVAPE